MKHCSRPQGLAIALAALSTCVSSTAAAKFDAGDAELSPNGAKKQGQEGLAAKKQVVIGDQPNDGRQVKFGTGSIKPAKIAGASKMPAYVEPAAAKKALNAHVHHRGSTGQFGGLGAKHHHREVVGVMDLVAGAAMMAKQHGCHSSTLLRS